jgi:putative restriction endonuclease
MLSEYIQRFETLNVARRNEGFSPHKPSMLLAVIGMIESGLQRENKIYFSHELLERYREIFDFVRTESDHANPHFPYFHLKSEKFWHLHPVSGRGAALQSMRTVSSVRNVKENIEYAYLDDELFRLLNDPKSRSLLKQELVTVWFGKHKGSLQKIFDQDAYEKDLRSESPDEIREASSRYEPPVRDAAFRRVVTEAYDYRCAASGHRLILPDGKILVQAAHIIPFSETHDDDPRNGIALTPDYHWAFDRGAIAPGPDMKWHVSKMVDDRIADNRFLLDLDGKDLIPPKQAKFYPKEEALRKCYERFKAMQ